MDRLDIGIICVVISLVMLVIRIPIGLTLISVSFVGIGALASWNAAWGVLSSIPYSFAASWELSAVPMFLLMGYVAARGQLTTGLFSAMRVLLNWMPGNLAVASVSASALFAAASGSSVATSAALARIAVPEMLKAKYDKSLATGTIAAAGTLGALIPPSLLMVVYGIFTNTAIGPLFIAGITPGLLTALAFIIMIVTRVLLKPSLAPKHHDEISAKERRDAFMGAWPLPLLVLSVLGTISTGIATPTEAGALGAGMAVLLSVFRGTMNLSMLNHALRDTALSTCTIFMISIGAAMFQRLLGMSQLPAVFAENVLSLSDNFYVIIFFIAIMYLILGMFLESIGIMLLTLPVLMPLLTHFDVNMIWFCIVVVKLLEIGMVTPPLGLNVYVVKSALGKEVDLITVFRGAGWFVVTDLLVLTVLVIFPIITLHLPNVMS